MLVTIIAKMLLRGEAGTKRWFLPFRQYQLLDITTAPPIDVSCYKCEEKTKFYKVSVENENFYIPSIYAVLTEAVVAIQDAVYYWDNKYQCPIVDFNKFYESLGIDYRHRKHTQLGDINTLLSGNFLIGERQW